VAVPRSREDWYLWVSVRVFEACVCSACEMRVRSACDGLCRHCVVRQGLDCMARECDHINDPPPQLLCDLLLRLRQAAHRVDEGEGEEALEAEGGGVVGLGGWRVGVEMEG
jgi:hypothetical protein